MQKKLFALLLLCYLLHGCLLFAAPAQWAFRVAFTDKNGTVDISYPNTFLSQRAIDRRSRYGIAIDSLDLPLPPRYIDSVLSLTQGVLHCRSKWLNECVVLLTDSSLILNLQNKHFISSVKWVAYYKSGLHLKGTAADKFEAEENAAGPVYDSSFYGACWQQIHLVNGECLHDMGYTGEGKLIAVLDGGFSEANTHRGFEALRQSGRLIDSFNFVSHTDSVFRSIFHGTQTLSTMAGYLPGSFAGTAPMAQYALYITEDASSEQPIELDNLLAGAERADSIGADVISISLGYTTFDSLLAASDFSYPDLDGTSTIAARAANTATAKGIVFVCSAGNDGAHSWHYIGTPADADSALTVGALTANGMPASLSSYGPNYANVTKPDLAVQAAPAVYFDVNNGITQGNGTSYAAPQVAGWVACLLQYVPTATPYLVRKAIDSSADHYFDPGPQIGYGLPDICKAADILNAISPIYLASPDWLQVYPTLFRYEKTLSLVSNLNMDDNVLLVLTDIAGRRVAQAEKYVRKGRQNLWLDIPSYLPAGMYLLHAVAGQQEYSAKLVKY